jgi:hypothetical protein
VKATFGGLAQRSRRYNLAVVEEANRHLDWKPNSLACRPQMEDRCSHDTEPVVSSGTCCTEEVILRWEYYLSMNLTKITQDGRVGGVAR